ncbi:MAG TPA: hypothetical protein VHX64_17520 [Caulobacteraceae bacterium]|nr:hypothetical protein [Caulobacteraceae bacterium]
MPDPTAALIASGAQDLLDVLNASPDGVKRVATALDAVDKLAAGQNAPAYVFIDEAQELTEWSDSDALLAELHVQLRKRPRRTTFLFAGSEKSLVDRMFFERGGLLYQDAQELALTPIKDGLARGDLRRSFRRLDHELGSRAPDILVTAADGRPLRMMLIANKASRIVTQAGGGLIDEAVMAQAVREARADRLWSQGGSTR